MNAFHFLSVEGENRGRSAVELPPCLLADILIAVSPENQILLRLKPLRHLGFGFLPAAVAAKRAHRHRMRRGLLGCRCPSASCPPPPRVPPTPSLPQHYHRFRLMALPRVQSAHSLGPLPLLSVCARSPRPLQPPPRSRRTSSPTAANAHGNTR